MRTATVRLSLRCNLHCGFCNARAAQDDERFSRAKLLAAMDGAVAAGVRELVLTGGEPTLRGDLTELVARACRGDGRVVLETNALALSLPGRAAQLAAAGGPVIRWGIAGIGATQDAMGQRPGAFDLGLRGVFEAVKAGLSVEIAFALTQQTLSDLDRLADWLGASLPSVRRVLVRIVTEAPAAFVARPRDAAQGLKRAALACRAAGIELYVDPRYALPLCALSGANHLPELFRVAAGGAAKDLVRVSACADCAVADLCAGVDRAWVARWGDADFTAVHGRHRRRALALASGRDARDALRAPSEGLWSEAGGAAQRERVIRVNFHCNQDCAFCFVDRVLPAPDAAHIRAQIDRAAADGVGLLSLSGGEPTLDPALADHIQYATALGLSVQIQTNATRLGDPQLARRLADAGLTEAFISLHGADAATSDAVTRAPGTFERTLEGIDQLLAQGVHVSLNCVITGPNYSALAKLPDLVATRWHGKPTLNFSYANANSALVPIEEAVIPAFEQVRPHLQAALDACRRLGLDWRGLTGECGVPLCFADANWLDPSRVPELGVTAAGPGFLKPDSCETCVISSRCVGVRAEYAELHGLDAVRPVRDLRAWLGGEADDRTPD